MNEAHGPPPQSAAEPTRDNAIDHWFVRSMAGLWLVCVIGSLIATFALSHFSGTILLKVLVALLMACVLMLLITVAVGLPLRVIVNLAVPSRRHAYRIETRWLAGILICLTIMMVADAHAKWSLSPPEGVTSLKEFSGRMPAPQWLELHSINGRDYVAWYGETASLLALPSGPSCYVFDGGGQLVDWQPETGDGGSVQNFLSESDRKRQITVEEALTLTRGKQTARLDCPLHRLE